jgi:hypothetical protein
VTPKKKEAPKGASREICCDHESLSKPATFEEAKVGISPQVGATIGGGD